MLSRSSASGQKSISEKVFHGQGIHSTVYRVHTLSAAHAGHDAFDTSDWTAIKQVSAYASYKLRPHDVRNEIRLLRALKHPHVITLLGAFYDQDEECFELHMPLIPLSLATLLDSPLFALHSLPVDEQGNSAPLPPGAAEPSSPITEQRTRFELVTKSIVFQIISALAYLHSSQPSSPVSAGGGSKEKIAHRDIKPSNVLIDPTGCVKLIDFGISWVDRGPDTNPEVTKEGQGSSNQVNDNEDWVEKKEKMCCQVATGPFRAPELLFAPATYDACATDLWSLGVLIAHLYRPLVWVDPESEVFGFSSDSDSGDEANEPESELDNPPPPFVMAKSHELSGGVDGKWERKALFDASRGEIAHIWSIFSIRGTPDEQSWPTFKDLPGARFGSFKNTPQRNIASFLPHLRERGATGKVKLGLPLGLIEQLLVYEPANRLSAAEALRHPWFSNDPSGVPTILPVGVEGGGDQSIPVFEGRTLGEWVAHWIDDELVKLK